MATEKTNAGGNLACPRCGKPATDLSIKIRKCTKCGCTLVAANPNVKLWDENTLLRLAVVALAQKLGIALHNARWQAGRPNNVEILTTEDLEHAAASEASVTTDGREARVVVRFGG